MVGRIITEIVIKRAAFLSYNNNHSLVTSIYERSIFLSFQISQQVVLQIFNQKTPVFSFTDYESTQNDNINIDFQTCEKTL